MEPSIGLDDPYGFPSNLAYSKIWNKQDAKWECRNRALVTLGWRPHNRSMPSTRGKIHGSFSNAALLPDFLSTLQQA